MRTRTTVVAAAILLAAGATQIFATPIQWRVQDGGNDRWYEAVPAPQGITWPEASAAATAMGGCLATIASAQENAFVYSLIDDDIYWEPHPEWGQTHGPWLGGYQPDGSPEPDGSWQWVTGEPFVYTNWSSNSPNNYNQSTPNVEDVIHFYALGLTRDSTWNDVAHDGSTLGDGYAYRMLGYVVESVPEPAALSLLALGGLALIRRGRK